MKILRKIITFIMVMLIIFTLTNITQVNTLASSSLTFNNEKITNVAVIIHRLDDPYMMRLKERLETIEKEKQKNVEFTFFTENTNYTTVNGETIISFPYDTYTGNHTNP